MKFRIGEIVWVKETFIKELGDKKITRRLGKIEGNDQLYPMDYSTRYFISFAGVDRMFNRKEKEIEKTSEKDKDEIMLYVLEN